VFVEDAFVLPPKTYPGAWKAEYRIKNAGQTPAHRARVLDTLAIVDWEPVALPVPRSQEYLGSLAPGGDFIDNETEDVDATPEQNRSITSKDEPTRAMMLVGRVEYLDVFNDQQRSEFCFYWQGPPSDREQMTAYDRGNDMT